MSKLTQKCQIALLEESCRKEHRAREGPRLIDETKNDEGTTNILVLGHRVLEFHPDGKTSAVSRALGDVRLIGRGRPMGTLRVLANQYVHALIDRVVPELLSQGQLERKTLSRIKKPVAGKLLFTLWGIRLGKDAERCFYAILWRNLNREAARLAIRMEGGKLVSLEHYNRVLPHLGILSEVDRSSPQLLPLVSRFCAQFAWCTKGVPLDRNVIQGIKLELKSQGLTEAGWRALARMGSTGVIIWRSLYIGVGIGLLNRLGTLGPVPVPASFMIWFRNSSLRGLLSGVKDAEDPFGRVGLQEPRQPQDLLSEEEAGRLLRIILGAAEKARRQHRLKRFILQELELVEDALSKGVFVRITHQIGWAWLMRHQVQWHEEQAAKVQSEGLAQKWTSLLPQSQYGAYQVLPLVNAWELYLEGKVMRHCVAGYADMCQAGRSRIFSIREPKARRPRATIELQLIRTQGKLLWRLRQVRAFANEPAGAGIAKVARQICARYNEEYSKEREVPLPAAA